MVHRIAIGSHPILGFVLAIGSAATFALSGIFASALISAGWSPGAATTARIVCAAAMLLVPTLILLRGQWRRVRAAWRPILWFSLLAVIGCQLAFFLAVQYIPPSLALLIEFMGPVLLVLWSWMRTRIPPSYLTIVGAVLAISGLIAVSGVVVGASLHPLGIVFALVAAVGNAAYYASSAAHAHGIAPLPFTGIGLAVAAGVLLIIAPTGLLPMSVSAEPAFLGGAAVSPLAVVLTMALVSTVISYVLGVAAARRLGATVASFTGYSEPLFGILWTIVFLAIVPTPIQWLGGLLIVAGVVIVQMGKLTQAKAASQERTSRKNA